jgi:NitT/TauT family transport system permease protein
MTALQTYLAIVTGGLSLLGLLFALISGGTAWPLLLVFAALGTLSLGRFRFGWSYWLDLLLAVGGAIAVLLALPEIAPAPAFFWFALAATWVFGWLFAERLAYAIRRGRAASEIGVIIPILFGVAILVVWEAVTVGANVPRVLLPPVSAIAAAFAANTDLLAADFMQTFVRAVLSGYVIGCGAAFLVAIAIDRSPFLKRGLLPLGSFVSALPLIGIAPIMVKWFGFGWESRAAVVVVMTFFPMLVNTIAGLNASGAMERDMMRTYAAGYWQTLFKLRLPAAAPFIFNALKINSTLALIGAIVAEFFGTPIVGMGFRISSEIGKLRVDMVWAEIAVAAVAGSAFYGVVVLIERAVTFWHPSVRGGRA